MERTTFARVISARVDRTELRVRKTNEGFVRYLCLPPPVLPDGKVHLHVEDDQAQQGQDHCEEKFQVLFIDLGSKM